MLRNEYYHSDPFVGNPFGRWDIADSLFDALAELAARIVGQGYYIGYSRFGKNYQVYKPSVVPRLVRRKGRSIRDIRIIPYFADNVADARDLANLPAVRAISLGFALKLVNASNLLRCSRLEMLGIEGPLDEQLDVSQLPMLKDLHASGDGSVTGIAQSTGLKAIRLDNVSRKTAASLILPPGLTRVALGESSLTSPLELIGPQPDLLFMGLYGLNRMKALKGLSRYTSLTHLVVEGASQLRDVSEIAQLPRLLYVEFRNCPRLEAPRALPASTQYAFFMGRTKLNPADAARLRDSPGLRYWMG
jgi:hypothetical protein